MILATSSNLRKLRLTVSDYQLTFSFLIFSNSVRENEVRAAAATEFHRRFHISVDETEGQGNQVNLRLLFRLTMDGFHFA